MTDLQTVIYAKDPKGVVRVTLNRPERRNAQDLQLLYDLREAFDRASQDDDVKVIVLAGAGDHFSSGHDLAGDSGKDIREFSMVGTWAGFDLPGAEGLMAREREIYIDLTKRLRDCPKPTIAEVHGWCIAGGLMLAWACDLIIASDDARFSDPVLDLGVAGVEYFAHPWELGVRKAKEFLFLGEPIDAPEAHRIGMVNRVVKREDLSNSVTEIARKIAGKPSFALKVAKDLVGAAEESMGRNRAIQHAFMGHTLCHMHNKDIYGVIIDPNGLPDRLKETVIERIRTEFEPQRRDFALRRLGVIEQ